MNFRRITNNNMRNRNNHIQHNNDHTNIIKNINDYDYDIEQNDNEEIYQIEETKTINSELECIGNINLDGFDIRKFENGDGIIVPKKLGERIFLSNMSIHIVRIKNKQINDMEVFGKIIGYNAPPNKIIMPRWMMESIFVEIGDKIYIDTVIMPKTTKIIAEVSEEIDDPKSFIEYELRDHSVVYNGKVIKSSMRIFDKQYKIIIKEVKPLYAGMILNSDIELEIKGNK